jgi:SNF2 family DNA or RNA helicase
MPEFDAATKKVHFEHLKSMIPEGCDNRRVKTQKRDLEEAWKMFGRGFITAVGDRCLMKGMMFGLLDYQLTAVGWMMSRECGRTSPYGGILADAPGLGKTVISLATIIGNPPHGEQDNEFCKATLVVVPNKDIAEQWHQEVLKHCGESWSAFAIKYSRKMNYPLVFIKQQLIV